MLKKFKKHAVRLGRMLTAVTIAAMLTPQVSAQAASSGSVWYEDKADDYITAFTEKTSASAIDFEVEIDLRQVEEDMRKFSGGLADALDENLDVNWGDSDDDFSDSEIEKLVTNMEIVIYSEDDANFKPAGDQSHTPYPPTASKGQIFFKDFEDLDYDSNNNLSATGSVQGLPAGTYYAYLSVTLVPDINDALELNVWTAIDSIEVKGAEEKPVVNLNNFTANSSGTTLSANIEYSPGGDDAAANNVILVYGKTSSGLSEDSSPLVKYNSSSVNSFKSSGGTLPVSLDLKNIDIQPGEYCYVRAYMEYTPASGVNPVWLQSGTESFKYGTNIVANNASVALTYTPYSNGTAYAANITYNPGTNATADEVRLVYDSNLSDLDQNSDELKILSGSSVKSSGATWMIPQTNLNLTDIDSDSVYYVRAYLKCITSSGSSQWVPSNYISVTYNSSIDTTEPTIILYNFTPEEDSYSASVSYHPGTDYNYTVNEVGLIYGDDDSVKLESDNSNRIDYTSLSTKDGGNWNRSQANWYGMDGFDDEDRYYVRAYMKLSGGGKTIYSSAATGLYDEDFGGSFYLPEVSNVEIVWDGKRLKAEGRVDSDGDTSVKERGFVLSYSDSNQTPEVDDDDSDVEVIEASNKNTDFTIDFKPDDDEDDIYIRAYAENSHGYGYARDTYHIPMNASRPTVYTMETENVMSTSADVTIMVSAKGSGSFIERGVVYSLTDSSPTLDTSNAFYESAPGSTGSVTIPLEDLEIDSDYYVRAYASNDNGTEYGETLTFTTAEEDDVVTNPVSDVTRTTAVVSGTITPTDDYTIRERGVVYSTDSSAPTVGNSEKIAHKDTDEGDFSIELTKLDDDTKYYVRAYIRTGEGYIYGNVRSFTPSESVSVTTDKVEEVTNNQAVVTGTVEASNNDDEVSITERGIVYDRANKEPTVVNDERVEDDDDDLGTFSVTLEDLRSDTTYYARAYAETGDGFVYYGEVLEITTRDLLVKTESVSPNGRNAVTVNASVAIYNDSLDISERGVAYSNNSQKPEVENDQSRLGSGTGSGNYTVSLTELLPNTVYYARAYVETEKGTTYGEALEFNTSTVEVKTGIVSSLLNESAVVSGTVINEGNLSVDEQGVAFSSAIAEPTAANSSYRTGSSLGDGAFQVTLDGLTPGTVYYARAFASLGERYVYGDIINFVTPAANQVSGGNSGINNGNYGNGPSAGVTPGANSPVITGKASSTAVMLKNNLSASLNPALPGAQMAYYRIIYNGTSVTLSNPILFYNGTTYLPMRALGEQLLGATVIWDEENSIAILVNSSNKVVETFAGSNFLVVDGATMEISTGAKSFTSNNSLYIPIRAISEGLDCKVYYEDATKTIYITSNN